MLLHDHLVSSDVKIFRDMFEAVCPGKDINAGLMLQVTEAISHPRTIKTHLPFSLLPSNLLDTCKVSSSLESVSFNIFLHSVNA